MIQLTDNELNILNKYEDRMRTAVYSDYARNCVSSDLDRLLEIYNKVKGINSRLNKSCSSCQLTFLKQIGRWWFEYKENLNKVVEEPEPILNINELENGVTNNEQITKKCPTTITKKTTKKQQAKK